MYDHLNCHYNHKETSGDCGHLKDSYSGIREGFLEEVLPLVGFKVGRAFQAEEPASTKASGCEVLEEQGK